MDDRATRAKQVNTTIFWRIIFPIMAIVVLGFVLFVVFTFPDEAIPASVKPINLQNVARATNAGRS
jgi:uncharacterized membrane protein